MALLSLLVIEAQAGKKFTGDGILYNVTSRAVWSLNSKGKFTVENIDHWYHHVLNRVKKLKGKQSDYRGKPVLAWDEANKFAQTLDRMRSLAREVVDLQARIRKDEEQIKWKPELKPEIENLKRQLKPKRDKLFSLRDSLSGLSDAIREKGVM